MKVFVKGEGGYYCHKIPYLYRTTNNVLIALAEGRGKDGRESCDDFSVRAIYVRLYFLLKHAVDAMIGNGSGV